MSGLPDEIAARKDLQSHLDKVRARCERDDLSALELRERHEDMLGQLKGEGIGTAKRERLTAEANLFQSMATERSAPETTPEEVLQDYQERGMYLEAEGFEHSLKIIRAREALEVAQNRVLALEFDASTNDTDQVRRDLEAQRTAVAEAERSLSEAESTPPPYQAREMKRKSLKNEVGALRTSATDMLRSQDPAVKQRGEAMQSEADQKEAQAGQLDRINRGMEAPPPAE